MKSINKDELEGYDACSAASHDCMLGNCLAAFLSVDPGVDATWLSSLWLCPCIAFSPVLRSLAAGRFTSHSMGCRARVRAFYAVYPGQSAPCSKFKPPRPAGSGAEPAARLMAGKANNGATGWKPFRGTSHTHSQESSCGPLTRRAAG